MGKEIGCTFTWLAFIEITAFPWLSWCLRNQYIQIARLANLPQAACRITHTTAGEWAAFTRRCITFNQDGIFWTSRRKLDLTASLGAIRFLFWKGEKNHHAMCVSKTLKLWRSTQIKAPSLLPAPKTIKKKRKQSLLNWLVTIIKYPLKIIVICKMLVSYKIFYKISNLCHVTDGWTHTVSSRAVNLHLARMLRNNLSYYVSPAVHTYSFSFVRPSIMDWFKCLIY